MTNLNNSSETDIRALIHKYFREFVHNRIGTLLTTNEKANINMLSRPNYTKGNLMVYQQKYQEYIWVVYIGPSPTEPLKKKIIIKENDNYTEKEVFSHSLYGYPENERVLPESGKHLKFDPDHIYETYSL